MEVHVHVASRPGGVFCTCGKVVDRAGLKKIDLGGFTGPASLVDSLEYFWSTGDPSKVKRPKHQAA